MASPRNQEARLRRNLCVFEGANLRSCDYSADQPTDCTQESSRNDQHYRQGEDLGKTAAPLNRRKSRGVMPHGKQTAGSDCTDDGRKKGRGNAGYYAGAEQTRLTACIESRTKQDRDGKPSRDKRPRIKIARRHEPVESRPCNERTAQHSGPQPVPAEGESRNLSEIPAIGCCLTSLWMNVFPIFLKQIARD